MRETASLSVVIPVYGSENCLVPLRDRLTSSLTQLNVPFEVILVNDCSPDNSWEIIKSFAQQDPRFKVINLSRNFGQQNAISAGLAHATNEWVVVMDCDLQDQPEEIGKLLAETGKGYDLILAQRKVRKDSLFKKMSSRSFFIVLSYLTGVKQDPSVANFGIYHSKVIKSVLRFNDYFKNFPLMVRWVGFKIGYIEIEHAPRLNGKSNYNLKRLLNLALDTIISFSDKPLRLTVKLGFVISLVSFLFGINLIISSLQSKITILGYASLMVSIWFLSGLMLIVLGVVGLYIGKIFEQVKGRPNFIISETSNIQ